MQDMKDGQVYMDYNATTPCDNRVVDAMLPYFNSYFGNAASRNHVFGWQAEAAVDIGREQVAKIIGASSSEIVFTSGATEADNLAIKGVFEAYRSKGNHIITCTTEHKAVLDSCKHIERLGGEITYLEVDSNGNIDLEKLEHSIRPSTILISLMYANNETGVIHPISEISKIARRRNILFFTDATQAVGKIGVDVNKDGIDLLAFSAHKLYGPKGIGALYVRRKNPRVQLIAQMDGGGHEKGKRSGTLNIPGIAGFGKACEIALAEKEIESTRLVKFRDKLEKHLMDLGHVQINGSVENRLPNVSNLTFKNVEAEAVIMNINKQIAISSGAACTSASMEPSHVLKAMGLPDDMAFSSLRFSMGRFTTEEEVNYTIEQICKTVINLRAVSPLWELNN